MPITPSLLHFSPIRLAQTLCKTLFLLLLLFPLLNALSTKLSNLATLEPKLAPQPEADELEPSRQNLASITPAPDDEENETPTLNPSVLGIIHLVDLTSPNPNPNPNPSASDQGQPSASQVNPVQQKQASEFGQGANSEEANSTNSSKVIRIYLPTKQSGLNSSDSHSSPSGSKRTNSDASQPSASSTPLSVAGTLRPPLNSPAKTLRTPPPPPLAASPLPLTDPSRAHQPQPRAQTPQLRPRTCP